MSGKPARKSIVELAFELMAAEERRARKPKKEAEPVKPAKTSAGKKRGRPAP